VEQGLAERVWTGGGGGGGGVDEEGGWVGNQSLGELASIGGGRGGRMEGWVEGRGRKGCVEPGGACRAFRKTKRASVAACAIRPSLLRFRQWPRPRFAQSASGRLRMACHGRDAGKGRPGLEGGRQSLSGVLAMCADESSRGENRTDESARGNRREDEERTETGRKERRRTEKNERKRAGRRTTTASGHHWRRRHQHQHQEVGFRRTGGGATSCGAGAGAGSRTLRGKTRLAAEDRAHSVGGFAGPALRRAWWGPAVCGAARSSADWGSHPNPPMGPGSPRWSAEHPATDARTAAAAARESVAGRALCQEVRRARAHRGASDPDPL